MNNLESFGTSHPELRYTLCKAVTLTGTNMTSAKRTFIATAPDGTAVTRKSAHEYVAAVLCSENGTWGSLGFSSTKAGAERNAKTWRGRFSSAKREATIIVVPAVTAN